MTGECGKSEAITVLVVPNSTRGPDYGSVIK